MTALRAGHDMNYLARAGVLGMMKGTLQTGIRSHGVCVCVCVCVCVSVCVCVCVCV